MGWVLAFAVLLHRNLLVSSLLVSTPPSNPTLGPPLLGIGHALLLVVLVPLVHQLNPILPLHVLPLGHGLHEGRHQARKSQQNRGTPEAPIQGHPGLGQQKVVRTKQGGGVMGKAGVDEHPDSPQRQSHNVGDEGPLADLPVGVVVEVVVQHGGTGHQGADGQSSQDQHDVPGQVNHLPCGAVAQVGGSGELRHAAETLTEGIHRDPLRPHNARVGLGKMLPNMGPELVSHANVRKAKIRTTKPHGHLGVPVRHHQHRSLEHGNHPRSPKDQVHGHTTHSSE
mmetsp:Transcript_45016/g.97782  ORF Transcript_45016/g.97782 Transcript_45016/m.97782 type:complete len:282 (+) Transcript_45016:77-922(+)